jgi:hypothetical protein
MRLDSTRLLKAMRKLAKEAKIVSPASSSNLSPPLQPQGNSQPNSNNNAGSDRNEISPEEKHHSLDVCISMKMEDLVLILLGLSLWFRNIGLFILSFLFYHIFF